MRLAFLMLFTALFSRADAQDSLAILVKDSLTNLPIAHATVTLANKPTTGTLTNADGYALLGSLQHARYTLIVSATGYKKINLNVIIPDSVPVVALLQLAEPHVLDDVIISSTRTGD